MALDETDFVDRDYQAARSAAAPRPPIGASAAGPLPVRRAPTREELDSQLTATQQQLVKLRETQEQLERERTAVEELRRRRGEFQTGREEMRTQLGRGIALIEKAEFTARRDAEQMARTLAGLREAIQNVEGLNEAEWSDADWEQHLGRGLTVIENARMEWNSARLKWPLLEGPGAAAAGTEPAPPGLTERLSQLPFGQLCRLGFALTWPLVILAALGLVALVALVWVIWRR